jgi:Holliday junction resolvase-like predicted endonuclease
MNSTRTGQQAEGNVAERLTLFGYEIIAQNWKTKVCEVDIIAKKEGIVYFAEVKYRSRLGQGSGLDYITPRKLNRIKFAARVWCQQNDWPGDYRLLGVEVSGDDYSQIDIVELD